VIAEERPEWGWGASDDGQALYPIVDGMQSIDNHYLLIALTYGMYALAAMVLILLWIPVRLFAFVLRHSRDEPMTALAVTMIGIFVIFIVSISTSWLGAQTQPLLFLSAGWSEALLLVPLLKNARVPSPVRRVSYRFERVMV
jgi:O-antigen ligase